MVEHQVSDCPEEFEFRHVVLQPTTGCNLNCSYCYLPYRKQPLEMSEEVTSSIAWSLQAVPQRVRVLWHGGEPLLCGLEKFRQLIKPFKQLRISGKIQHSLQTNATLITSDWCDFFKEEGFRVGVSLDGPEKQNVNRVNWAHKPSYSTASRGIEELLRHGIKFGIIAVVNPQNIDDPAAFYDFFLSIGCSGLSINVEEREGFNRLAHDLEILKVKNFWKGLFEAWRAKPHLRIREFENTLGWMGFVCNGTTKASRLPPRDFWPTVSFNGDVVVLSPEFMATYKGELNRFVIGNVLETPLHDIVKKAGGVGYVKDFFKGRLECRKVCAYYSYCGGGQASNKYYELGTTNATETSHCRNSKQAVIDAVLESLSEAV